MKKIFTLKKLAVVLFCVISFMSNAQISFTTNVSAICVTQPTNYVIARLTATNSAAVSYSWSILPNTCGLFLSAAADSAKFNISCGGNYTITCDGLNSSNQVVVTATSLVLASTNPTLASFATPSIICLGGSSTLVAGGANSYTWFPGNITGNTVVVTPTTSTLYSLIGSNNLTGCTSTVSQVVLVNPVPTLNISSSTSSICFGQSATLTASGAQTYTWSVGATGSQIVVSPFSSTCFSVAGANALGCVQFSVLCVVVHQLPPVNITGNATVCLGTSAKLTASGGLTYMWSNMATTNTVNVMVTTQTVISVSATGGNGCVGTMSVGLNVDPTCSEVWPGDANSDGVVSSTDVFEIGLGFSATGSVRSMASNAYVGQDASNWTGTVSTGKNLCHADCNGDGTIDHGDTVAIYNNFALTHVFKPAAASSNPDISLVGSPVANSGLWNVADVVVGSSTAAISQLYGLSFDLNFDANHIDDAYLVYTSSFLSASNQNVEFRKSFATNGKVVGVSVRTDKNNVSGNGKIAELHYKVKNTVPENTQLNFSVSNSQKISNNGVLNPLTAGTLSQNATNNLVALTFEKRHVSLQVYPNPASNELIIRAADNELIRYTLSDLSGRTVGSASFTGNVKIDVANVNDGIYFLELETESGSTTQKVVVDHR